MWASHWCVSAGPFGCFLALEITAVYAATQGTVTECMKDWIWVVVPFLFFSLFSFLWVIHLGQCWPHTSLRLLLTTRPGCSCHSPEISGHASWLPVFFLHVPEPFSWSLQERPHLPWPFREDGFFDPFLFQSNLFPLIINSRICNPRMFPR